jgi:hypothetical protein
MAAPNRSPHFEPSRLESSPVNNEAALANGVCIVQLPDGSTCYRWPVDAKEMLAHPGVEIVGWPRHV